MTFLYNAGIALYRGAARLASIRSKKVSKMLKGQNQTFAALEKARKECAPEGFDLWVHAASLGEFEQGRPFIERFRRDNPEAKILLSFFSPSGYEVRKDYKDVNLVVYLPFDTYANAERFVSLARPRIAVFVKYEFWGNYISALHRYKVPTYLISAIFRSGQIFFRPWGGEFRKMLSKYNGIFVQDNRSMQLLSDIGISHVYVAGDTRFDRVAQVMAARLDLPELEKFCKDAAFTLVIGSSWPKDEEVYIEWLHNHPEVNAICAPHEFDEHRLRDLLERFGTGAMLYSDYLAKVDKPEGKAARYIIVDCFGLLSSLYRLADVAIIGGGFGAGIHNLNEAAVYGVPVVFGPNHGRFKEATDLIACGGGFEMKDAHSGRVVLDVLFKDSEKRSSAGQAAGKYISDNVGATDEIYNIIFTKTLLRND